jgi:hypothetical protein
VVTVLLAVCTSSDGSSSWFGLARTACSSSSGRNSWFSLSRAANSFLPVTIGLDRPWLHVTFLLMVTVALYWKELLVVLMAVTIGLVWPRLRGIPLLVATVGWVWPRLPRVILLVSTVVFVLSGLLLSFLLTITLGLVWLQGCLQYFSGNGGYGTIKHFNYDQPNPAYYGHLNGQFSI